MTSTQALAALLVVLAASVGLWIGVRLTGRMGFVAADHSIRRKVVLAVLFTIAIFVGLWSGNHGDPFDPSLIALGLVFWCFAMFMVFRRPKRA